MPSYKDSQSDVSEKPKFIMFNGRKLVVLGDSESEDSLRQ